MRVAKRPLNPQAVKTANEKLWKDHPELKGRKLTMCPEDAAYRKAWVDAYLEAGGEKEVAGTKPAVGSVTAKCPLKPTAKATAANLRKAIEKCDGGTGMLDKAKKANGGKDVKIVVGTPEGGFDGHADTEKGEVVINKKSDRCTQIETAIFELSNMAAKSRFDKVHADATAGKLSREQYIRGYEKVEYDNVVAINKATKACKSKWGCGKKTFDLEGFRGAKNFEDYYKNYVAKSHKEEYGKFWDKHFKKLYNAKGAKAK